MKALELENYGVSEMTLTEQKESEGGGFWTPVLAGVGIAIAVYDAVSDMYEGFKETYNPPKK